MKYYYSKSKFAHQFFYRRIQLANLEHKNGVFHFSIIPFFNYSGKYHIHSVVEKDNNRTLFLTMKAQDDYVDFDNLNPFNQFFISLSHSGKKAMIFNNEMDGIILKS